MKYSEISFRSILYYHILQTGHHYIKNRTFYWTHLHTAVIFKTDEV